MKKESKYPALKVIASLLKVSGWFVIVAGIVGIIATIATPPIGVNSFMYIIGITVGIFFVVLIIFGYAEMLHLLIDVEGNTINLNTTMKDVLDTIKTEHKKEQNLIQEQLDLMKRSMTLKIPTRKIESKEFQLDDKAYRVNCQVCGTVNSSDAKQCKSCGVFLDK